MKVFREGKLRDSNLDKGNTLSVALDTEDIKNLANPSQGYAMARFGKFLPRSLGWGAEDKIHITLSIPHKKETRDRLANLRLDAGGDLYFTIWNGEPLSRAQGCEVFGDLDEFVQSDPSNMLHALGIEIVRLYGLNVLSRQLLYSDLM